MRTLVILMLGVLSIPALAAEGDSITYRLRIQIGETKAVDREFVVAFGSSLRVSAAGSLSYAMDVVPAGDGLAFGKLSLIDASGNAIPRSANGGYPRIQAGTVRTVSFTVCDDRVILQLSRPATAARCADLPPMKTVDSRPDGCVECLGAYEGMPGNLASRARITPAKSPGKPLVITGHVLAQDGSPRAGVIVYAFQTDSSGLYPAPSPPRSQYSQSHGMLRAWVRTGADGKYTFDTIEPGTYPDRSEPRHIHMVVIEPGCSTYFIEDIHFADDPLLKQTPSSHLADVLSGVGGSGIVMPQYDPVSGSAVATRDIHLGEKFENYKPCESGASVPRS